jgi:hypothetical protein
MITEQLIEDAEMPSYARRATSTDSTDSEMRLQAEYQAHFPRLIPPTQGNTISKRQCKVCSAKKLKSCEVALYTLECFKMYHTQPNL